MAGEQPDGGEASQLCKTRNPNARTQRASVLPCPPVQDVYAFSTYCRRARKPLLPGAVEP